MIYPKVSIIILNWNNWEDTVNTIDSVSQINFTDYNLILIDNGSTNDSVYQIKQYFHPKENFNFIDIPFSNDLKNNDILKQKLPVENFYRERNFLIETNENLGFSEGNNVGIRFCIKNFNPDYILLLNNDVIVDPAFLCELIQVADNNPDVGFLGPKIYYYDYKGRQDVLNFAGADVDFIRGTLITYGFDQVDKGQFEGKKIVDWVQGSCVLVRNAVIKDIGLLDPIYFFYWEDPDWCIRGKKNNWLSLFVPLAKVWHKCGMSSAYNENTFKTYYYTRNRLIFMKKNSNRKILFIFLLYYFGFDFWKILILYTYKTGLKSVKPYLTANIRGLLIHS
jgi:GT2 family glycosyltransferase